MTRWQTCCTPEWGPCAYHERIAEGRKEAREEPLSDREAAHRDDQWERLMDRQREDLYG